MNILLVKDHPMMTDSLSLPLGKLERRPEVRRASGLEAACRLAAAQPRPDLVMLDVGLPGRSAVEAIERFRERFPEIPVMVVSGASSPAIIKAVLDIGAVGFIPKSAPSEVFLRLLASGGIYLSVEALKPRVAEADGAPATRTEAAPNGELDLDLSPRQREVLSLLLKGLPNKLIARQLDISENTVKIHVSTVMQALGVSSRTQVLIKANRLGLQLGVS
jgi:DNA-binding NarL/FixJ family response regulator